jgi:MFS family permease
MEASSPEPRPLSASESALHALERTRVSLQSPAAVGGGPLAQLRAFTAANRFLLVFAGLSSLMGVSVGMALVTTSLYAVQLGSSEKMLGLIAGAQSVGVLVMSLPIGFWVDRFGPARLFVIGTLFAGATYALIPLHASPGFLLLCTALISFFMPMRFVSLNTVFLQQLAQLGEGKAGWYRGTHMIGMFLLGPLLAARLVQSIGPAWTYRLIAAAFLLTVFVSPIVFGRYAAPVSGRSLRWPDLRAQLQTLARDRQLLGLACMECFTQSVSAYFTFFSVVIALSVMHLAPAQASSLVSIKGVTFTIALFVLGGTVSRLGTRGSYAASLALLAGSLTALGLANEVRVLQLGSLTLGLGLGTLQINTLTQFARVGARAGHGKASGVNALFGPSGGLFSSLLGASLGKALGLQAVFLMLAGVSGLGCAALWLRRR